MNKLKEMRTLRKMVMRFEAAFDCAEHEKWIKFLSKTSENTALNGKMEEKQKKLFDPTHGWPSATDRFKAHSLAVDSCPSQIN